MIDATSPSTKTAPAWQGIHHIALVTPDLDATISFYQDVVGLTLVATGEAGEMHGRTAILHAGGQYMDLHFFEMPTAQIFAPPDLSTMHWLPGALHHISIALPDEAAGLAFQERLQAHGITMTPVMDQGDLWNIVFLDNNGMMVEAAWAKA
jgi:catechol 2,3-dioxygenase-like lactoylglutathione lyase family enzyme